MLKMQDFPVHKLQLCTEEKRKDIIVFIMPSMIHLARPTVQPVAITILT